MDRFPAYGPQDQRKTTPVTNSMFSAHQNTSLFYGAYRLLELIYHNTVRSVRKGHRDAVFAILTNIIQTLVMVGVFYVFMSFMGMRTIAIRGDFLLYIMSGIFVFIVNIKAVASVAGAEGPTSAMMQHLPMNTTIAIWSAAFSTLYIQIVCMFVILLGYHLLWTPLEIRHPVSAFLIILLAWFNGCSIGMVLLALKPWFPKGTGTAQQIYTRFNMFASGKMFIANPLPTYLFAFFSWNPLFHIIDQGRGYIFENYNPYRTDLSYPIILSIVFLIAGWLGESQTRKHASASWTAGR